MSEPTEEDLKAASPSAESMEKARAYLSDNIGYEGHALVGASYTLAALLDSERAQAREAAQAEEREKHAVAMRMRAELEKERDEARAAARAATAEAGECSDVERETACILPAGHEGAHEHYFFYPYNLADAEARADAAEARVRELEERNIVLQRATDEAFSGREQWAGIAYGWQKNTETLVAEVRELRAALEKLVKSMVPNPLDGPAMYPAWREAREALARTETPKAIVEPAEKP